MRKIFNKIFYMAMLFMMMLYSNCAQFGTKSSIFPRMYELKPLTILILPPINQTSAADAKEYLMSTLTEPIVNSGYYIFPLEITTEIFKNEGLFDCELITDDMLIKFKEAFNADAVLFITIKDWKTSYYVLGGNVKVSLKYVLKSTSDGTVLWSYEGELTIDTSSNDRSLGLVGNMLLTAVNTATTDYVPIAKKVNLMILNTVPFGKYHPRCTIDANDQVIIRAPR